MTLANQMGFVYKWTNNINLKWYIGSHKGTPDDGYIGGGKAFWHAIKKYGITNFTRTIIYSGSDYREQEDEILHLLDAASDKRSYNMHNHGWGGGVFGHSNNLGYRHTEETKKKMSKTRKRNGYKTRLGHKASEATKQKMSASHRGKVCPRAIDWQCSNETREKLSKQMRGKTMAIIDGKRTWIRKETL